MTYPYHEPKRRLALGAAVLYLACAAVTMTAAIAADQAPYAGEQHRTLKALSDERLAGLRAGAGLGYAKTAELNGWPGPLHVLELRETLGLSDDQIDALQTIREQMLAEAIALGRSLIDAEQTLETLFQAAVVTPASVLAATQHVAQIDARLRAVHLNAHLKTAPLLSQHQRHRYTSLRGYGTEKMGDMSTHNDAHVH